MGDTQPPTLPAMELCFVVHCSCRLFPLSCLTRPPLASSITLPGDRDNVFEEVAVDVQDNRCHLKDDIFDDFQDILLEFVCLVLENRVCLTLLSHRTYEGRACMKNTCCL